VAGKLCLPATLRVRAVAEIDRLVSQAGPGRPGFSSAEDQLKAAVYYVLAPLVVARMIERRLTLVDLSLDKRIYIEFVLAQIVCRSLSDEFAAAYLYPPLPYSPYVEGWREKRQECPQRYRRQGPPAAARPSSPAAPVHLAQRRRLCARRTFHAARLRAAQNQHRQAADQRPSDWQT